MRFDPRRVWDIAFPAPPLQSRHYLAVRVTDQIDRASLEDLLQRRRKNQTMSESTVLAIPQSTRAGGGYDHVALRPVHEVAPLATTRWGSPEYLTQREADGAIATALAAADDAATTSGTSFRDAMRKITELQSAEIERLRAIITDFSTAHPRKPISIAPRCDDNGRSRGVIALADDGTLWAGDLLDEANARWHRVPALPQPSDVMGRE